ncbi:collagenase-like [Calliphora vicina]|uniref:collagenase-like n=1 Tax=Calliphora vicina TaxID=7373 RepID=UPI00325A546B
MKFLIIFALALATSSAYEIESSNLAVPVVEPNVQNAAVGQFPYQVALFLKLSATKTSWCGASLIGRKWVLTTAYCTDGEQSVTVYLGATVRTEAEIKYTVSNSDVIIHAGWDRNTFMNDISLIKIPATTYTVKIQPVQLAALSSAYSTYDGDKVIVSGWSLVSGSATGVTTDLQWARMQVITNSVCARTYGSAITSSNICTSTPGGISTCQGDSGDPLVLESSKVLVGLSSPGFASGCTNGFYAKFTRVNSYLAWIEANTGISH